jgi:hypothetical protein
MHPVEGAKKWYVEATEMSRDRWLRRQAVQIAAQLPDGRDDALAVLRYANELVTRFLEADLPATPGSALRLITGADLPPGDHGQCRVEGGPAGQIDDP